MVDLKPCPFCGGEASIVDHHNDDGSVSVGCANDTCLDFSGLGWLYATEAEAIEAWNTRAERTCENVSVDKTIQFYCSKCECTVEVPLLWGTVNYCPNCGAKVIT